MTTRLVGVAVLAVAVLSAVTTSARASTTFRAPVYAGDFPDPAVLLVGGTYWAYATGTGGTNLQVMSSRDLRSWTSPIDPLHELPSWASFGQTWAPGVIQRGDMFRMYYTVRDARLNRQCVSVASSPLAQGPFVDLSTGPLVCQATVGGSIDPYPYADPVSGNLFLVWKSQDNILGHPTRIWAQQLEPDGLSLVPGTAPRLLLGSTAPWQAGTVEGPALVRSGGLYYLFYGGNSYATAASGIGYATSRSLLGPYTNTSVTRAWLATTGNAQGPQGPWVFTDVTGTTRMAFAAWAGRVGYQNGGVRSLWIGRLHFTAAGVPQLT
jgi:beta-xylosidase